MTPQDDDRADGAAEESIQEQPEAAVPDQAPLPETVIGRGSCQLPVSSCQLGRKNTKTKTL